MAFAMVEVASIASILFFLWIYSKYDRARSAQLPATGDTGRLQGQLERQLPEPQSRKIRSVYATREEPKGRARQESQSVLFGQLILPEPLAQSPQLRILHNGLKRKPLIWDLSLTRACV